MVDSFYLFKYYQEGTKTEAFAFFEINQKDKYHVGFLPKCSVEGGGKVVRIKQLDFFLARPVHHPYLLLLNKIS